MIPSIEECYKLLKEEKVPEHIIRHSEKVALVSLFIGGCLKEKGEDLNLPLLLAGALLHDIKKYESILTGINHAEAGYKLLKSLGYKRVAEIVKNHIYLNLDLYSPIKEDEIVFYADKRVKHEQIVSLKERFIDLKERYGRNPKSLARLQFLEKITYLIENRIFNKLPFSPEKVLELEKIKEVKNVLYKNIENSTSCWWKIF
ncbi:HD domain-containing protein [Thermodesulfobacterium hydrogeniphilum]|uniref:HD domain-containing protein n=1 Tax=Thermodesulfobacterium hydrogeniphilum TaxID=161156 RepID=UPI00068CE7D1|nr:HD domain-containing protein [Thermodesulfobacterium hydrogeniphilum]